VRTDLTIVHIRLAALLSNSRLRLYYIDQSSNLRALAFTTDDLPLSLSMAAIANIDVYSQRMAARSITREIFCKVSGCSYAR